MSDVSEPSAESPAALVPVYPYGQPGEPIALHEGAITIGEQTQRAVIEYRLSPDAGVRWNFNGRERMGLRRVTLRLQPATGGPAELSGRCNRSRRPGTPEADPSRKVGVVLWGFGSWVVLRFGFVRRDWSPDELIASWTLIGEDWRLVGNKTGSTRLGFALLLKFFELEARFPWGGDELPVGVVGYVAEQVKVDPAELAAYRWSGRTIEYHRAQVRAAFGFREATRPVGKARARKYKPRTPEAGVVLPSRPRSAGAASAGLPP